MKWLHISGNFTYLNQGRSHIGSDMRGSTVHKISVHQPHPPMKYCHHLTGLPNRWPDVLNGLVEVGTVASIIKSLVRIVHGQELVVPVT